MSLSACSGVVRPAGEGIVDITLIAFNDLHGNLEPPKISIPARAHGGGTVNVPAGGVAYMASAIKSLRASHPNNALVSAGDMVGASPLTSGLFLDEPTIEAANELRVDFNAVGNHEFDKGQFELTRLRHGGCVKYTAFEPCRADGTFKGAGFEFLAANAVKADGSTLFPATGTKTFGSGASAVTVGFIGMTLRATPDIVLPSGVKGLRFTDEADTANALVPLLKAQGAQIIVVLIHQGGQARGDYNDKSCPGFEGDIRPILDRLDAAVDVVVSGHTHRSYICDYSKSNPAKPFLLTSAGLYGTLLTDIELRYDTVSQKLVSKSADNIIVQGEGFRSASGIDVPVTDQYKAWPRDVAVDALIKRYERLAAPLAQRPVGTLGASLTRQRSASGESTLGNLVADSQLAATRLPENGGAEIAFMNPGGLRTDLVVAGPGSPVTYGQIFSVQPFGNNIVVKSMSGALLHALLEQQFDSGTNTVDNPRVLFPSAGFTYTFTAAAPAGSRIGNIRLGGAPVDFARQYRVAMNSYLADGGDNFSAFRQGTAALGGPLDVDALERYLSDNGAVQPPATDRITRRQD